jgi:hypothetical protein
VLRSERRWAHVRLLGRAAPEAEILTHAGFENVEINRTHQVHEHAAAAIIRARKPLN